MTPWGNSCLLYIQQLQICPQHIIVCSDTHIYIAMDCYDILLFVSYHRYNIRPILSEKIALFLAFIKWGNGRPSMFLQQQHGDATRNILTMATTQSLCVLKAIYIYRWKLYIQIFSMGILNLISLLKVYNRRHSHYIYFPYHVNTSIIFPISCPNAKLAIYIADTSTTIVCSESHIHGN